jgi:putative protease
MLLHNGADELYCGITTPEWNAFFDSKWWMNRRSPESASFETFDELKEAVSVAQEAQVPVHVALNAPYYPATSIPYLLSLCEKLIFDIAVDSLIVSDLNFLLHLALKEYPVRLHLSSLGGCFNADSVAFYKSLGIRRIILPRQLRISEIRELLARSDPEMEFEVFAVNDGCFYEEGFCQVTHALGPFCLENHRISVRSLNPPRIQPDTVHRMQGPLEEYLWYQNNCGSTYQETGLPNGPCSLCSFGHFRDWGVHAVKIVGREASFQRKLGSLQLVKAVMDEVRDGAPPRDIADSARAYRRTPEYCDRGFMCYFRET